MLLVAGIWSIHELNSIGSSVQNILDDNYQSIHAAKTMSEALEREDSAILLLLHGNWKKGRAILTKADSVFNQKLRFATLNITVPGEQKQLDLIKTQYESYKALWEKPIVGTGKQGNLNWYFADVHPRFLSVKKSVNNLVELNDKMMYKTATTLKNHSGRAIMPGIVAVIAALVFTFIFTYLINFYIVSPIIRITKRINKFNDKRTPFEVKIDTKDEIFYLAEAIEHLCLSIKSQDSAQ
jgi:methyl-accepting chemotaxis protein